MTWQVRSSQLWGCPNIDYIDMPEGLESAINTTLPQTDQTRASGFSTSSCRLRTRYRDYCSTTWKRIPEAKPYYSHGFYFFAISTIAKEEVPL